MCTHRAIDVPRTVAAIGRSPLVTLDVNGQQTVARDERKSTTPMASIGCSIGTKTNSTRTAAMAHVWRVVKSFRRQSMRNER